MCDLALCVVCVLVLCTCILYSHSHDLESGDTLEAVQPPGTYQLDEDEDIRENRNATVRTVQTLPTVCNTGVTCGEGEGVKGYQRYVTPVSRVGRG